MKRADLTALSGFFALVFVLSLPLYLLGWLEPQLSRWMPFGLPISALMFMVPALLALYLVYRRAGTSAMKALLARVWDRNSFNNRFWLLLSFALVPAALLGSYVIQRMLGQTLPEFSGTVWAFLLAFVVYFFGAIGEELGWMGYVIDPLQRGYGFWVSSIGLGLVWWLWHVIPYHTMGRSIEWILCQGLATVMFRILMVWIYNHAGRSLLTSIVFHAMINTSIGFFPRGGSSYDPMVTSLVLLGMVLLATWRQPSSIPTAFES